MTPPEVHLSIDADDGVRLAATRLGRASAAVTLVYVHPLLRERRFWEAVTIGVHEHLCGAVSQITYDQRGHGDSQAPHRSEVTTVARLARDLDTVLAHASGAVVLIAHGEGAQLVHAYATTHREKAQALAGLVFLNASTDPPVLQRYLRRWPQRLLRLRRHRGLGAVTAAGEAVLGYRLVHPDGHRRGLGSAERRVRVDVLAAYAGGFGFFTGVAMGLRHIPSAVLAGEHDPLVPPQRAVRLADALWADYDVVAGAGHELPRTHPARVTDTITCTLDHVLRTHLDQSTGSTHTPDTEPRRS
ncbi:alpha/beta fold hydrolase [Nocardia miyunensis]|uniref:alpha/beta fold hydrolase n=1 Tax=Nocardia miyunensis TaxID=282684 RepID=UPI00083326CB|nr:alpha/beta hydrolase [Nocardia miyunensis]